jgi:hypothetical protein
MSIPLDQMSLEELRGRRELARFCIETLETVSDSEPRKPKALQEYHRQFDEIQAAITAKDPSDKPEDIVVSVKSAIMRGSVPK